ncbi:MAG: oligosaccharide flippase family protein, partial [Myxococcales bacterium]|nr:oligosaccharide flippase family protein [Myxococcales bacterium]
MPGTSLSGKAKAGVAYSSLGRVGVTMLMLVRTVILVRLLPVRDFGVIQLCFMIVDMATTMGDFGFSAAQIQQKEDVRREQTNTLFAIDLSLKLVLFTVMLASVSTVSEYFREPLLKQVLPPLAAYMVLDCLTAPGFAILTRNMKFGTTARIEFTARVADSVVAIAIALGGGGVWSLVFGRLMASAISGALACSASGWRPSLKIDLQGSKGLVKFGGWLFVRNIFNYLADNVDYFFVGRILGTQQLGYYSKAFEVMRIPQSRLTRAITVVLFPAFAR